MRLSSPAAGHVLFALEDITEHKPADRTLRLMEVSLDQAPDMIIWLNGDGRVVHANEPACILSQRSLEEMRELHAWDLDLRLTQEAWPERWRMVKENAPLRLVNVVPGDDGEDMAFEVIAHPVEFEGNEYSVDFIRDITERVRAVEDLRKAQFSLDNIGDYPLWIDVEGRIFEVSESTCRHLEYSREELLNMRAWDVDVTLTEELWPDRWRRSKEAAGALLEIKHRTKSGRVYPVEIVTAHVFFGGQEYSCAFCRDVSIRKQLEENLYLAQLSVDQAPDMVLWIEPTGRIMYANDSICRFSGYSRDELQSMYVWELDPNITPDLFADNWQEAQSTAGLSEGTCLCKDGRLRLVELSSSKVTFEGKEVGVSFIRDIDERKRAEQILRDSEERYRQLFELESDAIILADDETGRILDGNSAAVTLYGYTRSELVMMNSSDLATEAEPSRDGEGAPGGRVRHNRRKDGTIFPAEVRHAYFESNGRPIRVAAVRDISERIKAEEEVLESRQMLQTVLDTVPLGISWRDRDLRYLGCNSAMMLESKVSEVYELLGKRHEELGNALAPPHAREDDLEVIDSGIPKLQYEETLIGPHGSQRIVRSSKVPLRNRAGEIMGVLSVHEDVTERRMTLNALR